MGGLEGGNPTDCFDDPEELNARDEIALNNAG